MQDAGAFLIKLGILPSSFVAGCVVREGDKFIHIVRPRASAGRMVLYCS
jgi:hypothetical protein